MRKHTMPQALQIDKPQALQWDVSPQAFARWSPNISASAAPADNTISILEPIGLDAWTGEGVTAKRISAALRTVGANKDVTVHINSPGGSLSEGMTIYNMLREHKGEVTVKILGVAASAASIIAMGGDQIQIARSGFLMVHNAHIGAIGNRHDLRDMADMLEPFDMVMADIYMARTGMDTKTVQKKMDAETFINGSAAVDEGWADSLLPADQIQEDKNARAERTAAYQLDVVLAKAGMPRSERRSLLQDFKAGTRNAAGKVVDTPCAIENGTPRAAEASELMSILKSF